MDAMPLKGQDALHPDGQYSRVAKWFHWLTVGPMAMVILSGLTIRFMKDDVKMSFYALHENLGLLLLGLSVARLAWRRLSPPPAPPSHLPPAMQRVAHGVHLALYGALIAMPLIGFLMTNAYGFPMAGPTAILGVFDQPKFMEANQTLAWLLHWGHSLIGWALPLLIGAHVAGAVYHHAIRRDGTLLRML